jgi:CRISPR-associated protein Cas2
MSLNILVCYDVKTSDAAGARRLRRLAEACKGYGVRVQFSVFECSLQESEWVVLRARLLEEMDDQADSLRFYFINEGDFGRREHHGVRSPIDPRGPLVV